jgi:uncharacterized membrane protein
MESLFVLIGIAYLLAPIVAFVFALGARNRADELEIRIVKVERQLQFALAARSPSLVPGIVAEAKPLPVQGMLAIKAPLDEPEEALPPSVLPAPALLQAKSLEKRGGVHWAMWTGGLALAIGGYFLFSYSIDQGLMGPRIRVLLGGLLAAVLAALGEWARRRDKRADAALPASAYLASILTAAATTVAFVTIYAAYAFYDLLATPTAFPLLGFVALATLAAALRHGPALAGFGLVGAELAPIMVASDHPNYWALYTYLAIVTATTFALARVRRWRWLAITAAAFGLLWMFPGIADHRSGAVPAHVLHAVAGFTITSLLVVSGLVLGPGNADRRIDGTSSCALAAYLVAAAALVIGSGQNAIAIAGFIVLATGALAIARRAAAGVAAVPVAAALAVVVLGYWAIDRNIEPLDAAAHAATTPHVILGVLFAALFGIAGYHAQRGDGRAGEDLPRGSAIPILWAAGGVLAPLGIVVALDYGLGRFGRSLTYAGVALILAALFTAATNALDRRGPQPGSAASTAIYAGGSVAALALTFALTLERGWLTIALALIVPGLALVAMQRPLPFLRALAAIVAGIVVLRVAYEPRIVGAGIATTPIFNWLLYGYGIPALSFWLGGHLLRRRADDLAARAVETAAILLTALLALSEVRHLANHGDIYAETAGLAEIALEVCTGTIVTIGLEWMHRRSNSVVCNVAARVAAALTLIGIVVGLFLLANPFITGEAVGGVVFNLILLGYGAPAGLALVLARTTQKTRPLPYRTTIVVIGIALALMYLSLEVARIFQGEIVSFNLASNAEQYTYSAVWLAFGVALLIAGVMSRSEPVLLASAAAVMLTIGKTFVIDMGGLTGAWRALSFLGLALVLVGTGWVYQRLLYPARLQRREPTRKAAPPLATRTRAYQ